MQQRVDPYDRRKNRGFGRKSDDLDLNQREGQRRNGERISLRLWTEGRCDGALDFHNCSNLSDDGMFVENPEPYPVGAMVDLEFNLPGIADPIHITARVVSCIDGDTAPELIMGNGFRFERISNVDRELIRAYVRARGRA
jgi:Tfp pilus assembly protein PilZ